MEGMWTRFFPLMEEVRRLVSEGAIGEVRMLNVDFGFRADLDPASRLFDQRLGGGALLDVGVYCVSFASMVLGRPSGFVGLAHLGETGVDEQASHPRARRWKTGQPVHRHQDHDAPGGDHHGL
jgi:predicted dehydrogenase